MSKSAEVLIIIYKFCEEKLLHILESTICAMSEMNFLLIINTTQAQNNTGLY